MKSNFPKIPLLFSILFFLLSCVILIFVYRFINNKNQEVQSQENRWQTEENRRDGIKLLDNSVSSIQDEKSELETHFAPSSDVVPFLDTIEGLASEVNAQAAVTSVSIASDNSGLLVGMNASGTFASLYRFLTLLENSPYELNFVKVEMHQDTGSSAADGQNAKAPKWNEILSIRLLSFTQ